MARHDPARAGARAQRYYEQKNTGAKLSSGEVLIFLDSDVVPDEGWLEGLLAAMDDPSVGVVGGETYHATDTLHDKLFAAFWTFTTRRESRGIYRYKNFYANNLAVRRDIFLANPYPDAAAYRGQCSELARIAAPPGHRHLSPGRFHRLASAARGRTHVAVRALCQGYDAVYWKGQRRFGMLLNTNPVASLLRLVRQMGQVLVKVTTRAHQWGWGRLAHSPPSPWGSPTTSASSPARW